MDSFIQTAFDKLGMRKTEVSDTPSEESGEEALKAVTKKPKGKPLSKG